MTQVEKVIAKVFTDFQDGMKNKDPQTVVAISNVVHKMNLAFINYTLYDGEPVIHLSNLTELAAAETMYDIAVKQYGVDWNSFQKLAKGCGYTPCPMEQVILAEDIFIHFNGDEKAFDAMTNVSQDLLQAYKIGNIISELQIYDYNDNVKSKYKDYLYAVDEYYNENSGMSLMRDNYRKMLKENEDVFPTTKAACKKYLDDLKPKKSYPIQNKPKPSRPAPKTEDNSAILGIGVIIGIIALISLVVSNS